MDLITRCLSNTLETLHLQSLRVWEAHQDFLIPITNKESGFHHFSRLETLKLCDVLLHVDEGGELVDMAQTEMNGEANVCLSRWSSFELNLSFDNRQESTKGSLFPPFSFHFVPFGSYGSLI